MDFESFSSNCLDNLKNIKESCEKLQLLITNFKLVRF